MSLVFRSFSQCVGLTAAASALFCAPAFAATTIYTTQASFLAATAAGYYTEAFTGSADAAGSYDYSGGAFGYTVTAPAQGFDDDVYLSGTFIGNYYSNSSLTVTFTAGAPTAIGGNFYITDVNDAFVPAALVVVTLSDGTTTSFTPTSASANSYRGFTSTVAITSLTLSAPGASRYNTIDNFTVGRVAAVPEPGTYALMAGGLLVLAGVARRRRG